MEGCFFKRKDWKWFNQIDAIFGMTGEQWEGEMPQLKDEVIGNLTGGGRVL